MAVVLLCFSRIASPIAYGKPTAGTSQGSRRQTGDAHSRETSRTPGKTSWL